MKNEKDPKNHFHNESEANNNYEDIIGTLKVDSNIFSVYEDTISENLVEYRNIKSLNDEMYKIFNGSDYFEKYKRYRKVDKSDLPIMYYYFKEKLSMLKMYTDMEIFIAFAEMFQISYEQLYSDISVSDKENILKELDNKYKLNSKIKTKKLF